MQSMMPIGIYLHVPFCGAKCPYCDFYSGPASQSMMEQYTKAIETQLRTYQGRNILANTLYFGGGTPNLLGGERIARIIETAKTVFSFLPESEITLEANPATTTPEFLQHIQKAGVNRLSLGLQSANDLELRQLGRRHTPEQVLQVLSDARQTGISNLSLDLMLGIPGQTKESLLHSIAFCQEAGATHISAYLLKLEPGTAFFENRDSLSLPDDETVGDWYLFTVAELGKRGFQQYEISNFAKPGFAGQHNLKYWRCQEYLGFGPSAHSFWNGKRFYFPRSTTEFLAGGNPLPDGDGGSPAEYAMLQLRLTEGLCDSAWRTRFGQPIPTKLLQTAKKYENPGLIYFDSPDHFHLTPKGFLVSNLLIGDLITPLQP